MTTKRQAYQLPGKVCSNCKSTGPFLLDPSDKFTIAANGHLEFPPDEWGLDIACDCPTCGFAARLEDFCVWVNVTGEEREATIRAFLESNSPAHPLTAEDESRKWWGRSFDGTTTMDRRNQLPVREVSGDEGENAKTDDDLNHGEPKADEFVWSDRDAAELWWNIVNDASIDPVNWRAAYRAALRGEPEWWFAIACPDDDGDGLV